MKRQSIQEYLGLPKSWPVKEKIKHAIMILPNEKDIKSANKKDPQACALHHAACRLFNVPNAAIGGRWAYIPQRDERGNPYIARMQAPPKTQAAIKKFDRTGVMPEGGFKFVPLNPSQMYLYKRRYMRLWTAGKVGGQGKRRKWSSHRRQLRALPMTLRT